MCRPDDAGRSAASTGPSQAHDVETRSILLAATSVSPALMRGIVRGARAHRWHLVTDMLHTGAFPRGWKGDGILAVPAYQPDLASYIAATGIPCTSICLTDEYSPGPHAEPDNVAAGRMAARYFLDLAHRTFAWAPFINDRHNRERLSGFESVLREHRRTCVILPPMHRRVGPYWHDDWSVRRATLLRQLKALAKPAAVFAFNDCTAAEIAHACAESGLHVPGEIAILGFGNDPTECESRPVALSSIDPDTEQLAFCATEILAGLLSGRAENRDRLLVAPKGVVARTSTGARAIAHPRIAQALACIADSFPDPMLGVATVAETVGLSRRQLERDFRDAAGCTVRDFIERSRMNEASRLLRDHPKTKISTVAELVGLPEPGSFLRTFRRHFGVTPSEFRHHLAETGAGPGEESAPPFAASAATRALVTGHIKKLA